MRQVWRMKRFWRLYFGAVHCTRRIRFQGNTLVLTFELYRHKHASLHPYSKLKKLQDFWPQYKLLNRVGLVKQQ
jgi:hypothetical protein